MAQAVKIKISRPEVRQSAKKTQFLTFMLGRDLYGIDILKVQEIKSFPDKIALLSHSPAHFIGIAHLYNAIVPIIDLRAYFQIENKENTPNKMVIILNLQNKYVGLSVSGLFDIVDLSSDQIKSTPEFCTVINKNYINGVGIIGKNMLLLLDIEKFLFSEDLQLLESASLEKLMLAEEEK